MKLYKYFLVALFISPLFLKAQNVTIEGKVVDKFYTPVIGATISILKNTKIGAITDADGLFSLEIPQKDSLSKIVVSGAGFKDTTFIVKTIPKNWVVKLEEDRKCTYYPYAYYIYWRYILI